MIPQEFFKIWLSEKIDKQILSKIPYLSLISIALFFLQPSAILDLPSLLWLFVLLFITYLVLAYIFRYRFWRIEEELIVLRNIRDFRKKLRSIFEEKRSIFEDIKIGLLDALLFLVAGAAFSLFLVLLFLVWFETIHSEITVVTVAAISLLLVSHDIMKSDLFEEVRESSNSPFIEDVVERYILTNFLEKLPGGATLKDVLLKLLYRLLSPPLNFPTPKITFDILMVYKKNSVDELLKKYANKNNNSSFYLKHVDGLALEGILRIDGEGKGVEKVSLLIERSSLENFPYLFDPDYEYNERDNRKWCMLAIIEKSRRTSNESNSEKILGYIIIHAFKGCFLKRKYKKLGSKSMRFEIVPKAVYLFIFIGSRGEISFLKKEIEFRAPKVDPSIINLEVIEEY